MAWRAVFTALEAVCEENITALSGPTDLLCGNASGRLLTCMRKIQDHGRALEPVVAGFTAVYHHYDFDADTPGNGYRTLVKGQPQCLRDGSLLQCPVSAAGPPLPCSASAPRQRSWATVLPAGWRAEQEVCEGVHLHAQGLLLWPLPGLSGMAAFSFLTSAKYVIDPELRGAEFERITQNLDMKFWKSFWNLTESELLSGLASVASNLVQLNLTLTIPPEALRLPLASDPRLFAPVSPPVAHWGPGPVNMRLISYELREGQDSDELLAFSRTEATPISVSLVPFGAQKHPPSPWLLIHFHGGGFVAQTSKSHENYLKSWSKDLNVPILSVDYSLAPEAPFPRALEECFYAYCWALKNCHLLGSTAERVCLAGDSAGGNLCITVSMRAIACGVRVPDGIMAAYPATLLTIDASPSRLLTLIDPLLPLGVLSKCLNAYAGVDSQAVQPTEGTSTLSALGRDTALLISDLTHGASNWIQSFLPAEVLGSLSSSHQKSLDNEAHYRSTSPSSSSSNSSSGPRDYPEGFEPLRSERLAVIQTPSCPIVKNPFVSPLLSPDDLLRGLPPVHLVASALDALLDDSVMFAKKLRDMGQPVTLRVVEDLPHGFLSLLGLAKETQVASDICVARIREVFQQQTPPPCTNKQPKLERTNHGPSN
ncbi:lipase, hormone-sensitive a isoform X2 [Oncorhynchus tshawytscha]|uniref:Hormone-sensitive lipase n=1 Tax=Oncorhynchus tshawytscha TaxID=74940 RepID=A0AAZ3QDV5_ONCTS|nr:lipase, hormone-sensitive a isoform X2 [Oncorhynchus tshawytscha]